MPEAEQQYPNALARLLVEARRNYGYSTAELARHIGCHRSHLYRLLKGESLPENSDHLQGIARACHRDLAFIQKIVQEVSSPTSPLHASDSAKKIRKPPSQIQGPAELFSSLPKIAEDIFQADQVELFLGGLAEPLPYLWCVNSYLIAAPRRSTSSIPLYRYVREWENFTPQCMEDIIVRAFASQQIQEFSDSCFLHNLGVNTTWLLVAPLVSHDRSIGCLVFKSSSPRAYLTLQEAASLKDLCRWLVNGLMGHPFVFDRMSVYHAARMMIENYRDMGGEELSTEKPAHLVALSEQASLMGHFLLQAGNQLRRAHFPFHDISIQQIDEESGTMIAIGTKQKGKGLLPPALFDATTAVPCWEAFKSKKFVYRPDLLKDDPYSERDHFTQKPVLSIIDLPFSWDGYRGTLGINSLDANPWTDNELMFLEEFVKKFRLAKM